MRFVSWNVNGLRACLQKGFLDFFMKTNADFFCLQETKLQEGQIQLDLPGYQQFWCYAEKKGYSGTAIFTKHTPQSVAYGLGIPELDTEGRLITLEYPEFYLVTCYTPNAQRELARIEHRMKWEAAFREYLVELDRQKPVILCGDLNVAHKEIDLKNPGSNRGSAGFSDQEREAFGKLLDSGFTDTFRHLHPGVTGAYTWWSYMFNARKNNAGWRIDYFVVSDRLKDAIHATPIHADVLGSDHCPVELDLAIGCNGGIWWSSELKEPPRDAAQEITEKKEASKLPSHLLKPAAAVLSLIIVISVGFWLWSSQISHNFSDWFTVTVIDKELSAGELSPENANTGFIKYTDGTSTWYTKTSDNSDVLLPEDATWWIRLDLTLYGKLHYNYFSKDQIELSTSNSADQLSENRTAYAATVPWYAENGDLGGYFIYASNYNPRKIQLQIREFLSDNPPLGKKIAEAAVSVVPIISTQKAQKMSTFELVIYTVNLKELYDAAESADSIQSFEEAYHTIAEGNPAIKELESRSDAPYLLYSQSDFYSSSLNQISASQVVARKLVNLDVYQFVFMPWDDPLIDSSPTLPPSDGDIFVDVMPIVPPSDSDILYGDGFVPDYN